MSASRLLRADWPAPPGVHAMTTLRDPHGGTEAAAARAQFSVAANDAEQAQVVANRAALRALAQLPSEPHWLRQVHGIDVAHVDSEADSASIAPRLADAAVTRVAGTVLAILTADCLPVLFCARDGREVAAAHAGWRGLAAGVLERTLAAMHTPATQVIAWLGPAAGPQAYEVGAEVRAAFVDADAGSAEAFVATRPGHWHADLYALARRRLAQAGVASIHGGGECTISDPERFFSHRRDASRGRMASLLWFDAGRA